MKDGRRIQSMLPSPREFQIPEKVCAEAQRETNSSTGSESISQTLCNRTGDFVEHSVAAAVGCNRDARLPGNCEDQIPKKANREFAKPDSGRATAFPE